jgi:hypothetical protein
MNAAAMAAQSDPLLNRQFSRRWTGPPPLKRRSPALASTSNRAVSKSFGDDDTLPNNRPPAVGQRALHAAVQRAARLDRRAELLDAIGHRDAALRIAATAVAIRAVLR